MYDMQNKILIDTNTEGRQTFMDNTADIIKWLESTNQSVTLCKGAVSQNWAKFSH